VITEFSGPKVKKFVILTYWYQYRTQFVDNDKNVNGATVLRIILKCNHKTIIGVWNYITYTNKE
jgi:hypothetical protein